MRVPWTARRSNQSILKEISPGCSLEELMLKLKLQYFGHLMRRADSLEKTLMLGKIEGRRRRGRQRMIWLDGITDSMDMGLGRGAWWATVHQGAKSLTQMSVWHTHTYTHTYFQFSIFLCICFQQRIQRSVHTTKSEGNCTSFILTSFHFILGTKW